MMELRQTENKKASEMPDGSLNLRYAIAHTLKNNTGSWRNIRECAETISAGLAALWVCRHSSTYQADSDSPKVPLSDLLGTCPPIIFKESVAPIKLHAGLRDKDSEKVVEVPSPDTLVTAGLLSKAILTLSGILTQSSPYFRDVNDPLVIETVSQFRYGNFLACYVFPYLESGSKAEMYMAEILEVKGFQPRIGDTPNQAEKFLSDLAVIRKA